MCTGQCPLSLARVFTTANNYSEKRRAKAERFLSEFLADGRRKSDDVVTEGKKQRLSRNALFEAKRELGIAALKIGADWYWELPGTDSFWPSQEESSVPR